MTIDSVIHLDGHECQESECDPAERDKENRNQASPCDHISITDQGGKKAEWAAGHTGVHDGGGEKSTGSRAQRLIPAHFETAFADDVAGLLVAALNRAANDIGEAVAVGLHLI